MSSGGRERVHWERVGQDTIGRKNDLKNRFQITMTLKYCRVFNSLWITVPPM